VTNGRGKKEKKGFLTSADVNTGIAEHVGQPNQTADFAVKCSLEYVDSQSTKSDGETGGVVCLNPISPPLRSTHPHSAAGNDTDPTRSNISKASSNSSLASSSIAAPPDDGGPVKRRNRRGTKKGKGTTNSIDSTSHMTSKLVTIHSFGATHSIVDQRSVVPVSLSRDNINLGKL